MEKIKLESKYLVDDEFRNIKIYFDESIREFILLVGDDVARLTVNQTLELNNLLNYKRISKQTLYGYDLDDLIFIAKLLRENIINENELQKQCDFFAKGYDFAIEDIKRIQQNNINNMLKDFKGELK